MIYRCSISAIVASLLILAASFATLRADDFKLEEGYTLLFNGKDLAGWKTKNGESLDGKSDAYGKRFVAADGLITIDPTVKGDVTISTATEFAGDVSLRFEFKPGAGCNNDLFFRGLKFDLKPDTVKNLKQDEWNTFEIEVKGDAAEFKCNGESQRKEKTKAEKSPLGIRAEFGAVEFRHIRMKAAKK